MELSIDVYVAHLIPQYISVTSACNKYSVQALMFNTNIENELIPANSYILKVIPPQSKQVTINLT